MLLHRGILVRLQLPKLNTFFCISLSSNYLFLTFLWMCLRALVLLGFQSEQGMGIHPFGPSRSPNMKKTFHKTFLGI